MTSPRSLNSNQLALQKRRKLRKRFGKSRKGRGDKWKVDLRDCSDSWDLSIFKRCFLGKIKESVPIASSPDGPGPSTRNPWATSASSASENKSPWKTVPSVEPEPIKLKTKASEKEITSPMKSIIADEEEKKRNLDRAKSKPLTLTLVRCSAISSLNTRLKVFSLVGRQSH